MPPEVGRAEQLEIVRGIVPRLSDIWSWSEAELRDRLALCGIPEGVSGELTERFREVGLLDDTAFVEALAQTRVQIDRHGLTQIRAELRRRGVGEDVAAGALFRMGQEEELEAA